MLATARRAAFVPLACLVALGCAAPASTPASPATAPPASVSPSLSPTVPTTAPTIAPTAEPTPTPDPAAFLAGLPVRGREVRRTPIEFGLVTGKALLGQTWQPARVERYDPKTHNRVGVTDLGSVVDAFPPDAQSLAHGKDGVWVTLASQKAVALLNPATGKVVRRIEVDGQPYNLVEHDGELWIADFEGGSVLRVDLATGRQTAIIPVRDPTGITFGEGAVWATVHVGRHDRGESIEGHPGQLARIDPVTEEVTLYDVGPRPYWVTTAFGSAWTGNATGAAVSRVDPATGTVTTIPVGADGAFDVHAAGDRLWVGVGPQYWSPECGPGSPTGGTLSIDPATNRVDGRVDIPCAGGIVPDGKRFWVHVPGGGMALIDPTG